MKIGIYLRKLRNLKSLTTRQVSERAGISLSTYVDWENDKSTPSLRNYFKLATAFQACPIELMAYINGHVTSTMSPDEKMTVAEMRERIQYYKEYFDLLKGDKERLEKELTRLRVLLGQS